MQWTPICALTNIDVEDSFGCEHIALTHASDERVVQAFADQPSLKEFFSRFTDAFGNIIRPSILIVSADKITELATSSAVASFVDVLAISTIPKARASKALDDTSGGAPVWSDSFDAYPWMLDQDGTQLLARTPELLGINNLNDFSGQMLAGQARYRLNKAHIDQYLFEVLLSRLLRRYCTTDVNENDERIFRSLNMAFSAMRMPGVTNFKHYDIGRLIILMISAIDILLHVGRGSKISKDIVLDKFKSASWIDTNCSDLLYEYKRNDGSKTMINRAGHLYTKILKLRNKYCHGDPINDKNLAVRKISAIHISSSLYWFLLVEHLGINLPALLLDDNQYDTQKKIQDRIVLRDMRYKHEKLVVSAS